MLQLKPETPDLWDSILPEELRKLPEELARVDLLLQDERLMEPFVRRFSQTQGRPGVPISTYLRLMYLKFLAQKISAMFEQRPNSSPAQ